tara:strand:- start:342 stop:671 length:330 start_codon:yes stop_codon:yes gene_type:complete
MIKQATKKPVAIEFIEWTGQNHRPMFDFLSGTVDQSMDSHGVAFYISHEKVRGGLVIKTLEGEHVASVGDMIIKGVKGEFYPCKPDIFAMTYDVAGDDRHRKLQQFKDY